MGLRDKYAYAIQACKGKLQGNAEEKDGKLYLKGTVASEAEKNEIWNAIKTIPDWQKDSRRRHPGERPGARWPGHARRRRAKSYTVKSGDTLSKIAKETARQRRRVHEDLRRQQGRLERSGQDQARVRSFAFRSPSAPAAALTPLPGPSETASFRRRRK